MKFVYSAGGYAREFRRLIRLQYPGEEVVLVDDGPGEGHISYAEALAHPKRGEAAFVIGFANPALRRRMTERVLADGFPLFSVCAPNAVVSDEAIVGESSVISDFSIVQSNDVRIGRSFHANVFCNVGHDCVLGDFVTLAPRVIVNGRIEIEDDVYIGTGATVLPGKPGKPMRIGKGAVIGAHALVTADVPPGATMVGTPANPLKPKPPGS